MANNRQNPLRSMVKSAILIMVVISISAQAQKSNKGVVYLHINTDLRPSQDDVDRDDLAGLARKRQSNDRIMPWMRKHLSDESYAAMEHCGDYLVMLEDETRTRRKLDVGYFCRQRLCAGCAWRSAVKSAQCVSAIAGAMIEQGKIMLMVTLTVPNVPGNQLRQTIQHLGRSWMRLLKRERYKCWGDNVRKVEITYNADADTYHPHMHIVVFVSPGYLRGSKYISHDRLLRDWREVTGQPEITQVDVRRCRDRGTSNAILEVAKYATKASDYGRSEDVLDAMYHALHHTRIMTYAGRCKTLRQAYECGQLERYAEIDTTRYTMRVVYIWQRIADASIHTWQYVEHDTQPYDMDAAEIARLQRDQDRLTAYALAAAERADKLDWIHRTRWVREFADMDDVEMLTDEPIRATLPPPVDGEQVTL